MGTSIVNVAPEFLSLSLHVHKAMVSNITAKPIARSGVVGITDLPLLSQMEPGSHAMKHRAVITADRLFAAIFGSEGRLI